MKMTEEMFEMLIGKYLDGEITPSEQRLLEAKLDSDPKASQLLEEFQNLHDRSCEVLGSELLEKGKSPQEIFQMAVQQSKTKRHHIIKLGGWTRFASGVAAGLIFGLALHFNLLQKLSEKFDNPASSTSVVATNLKKLNEDILLGTQHTQNMPTGEPVRNVDYYRFTDDQGNQWMVEGLRENIVRPAVYQQGI
jgi:anti-sigma factor RsiW